MTAHALTTVEFHGDVLLAAEVDGEIYVAIKLICERLGLDWPSQFKRLKRDSVLSEGIAMMAIPSAGGLQDATLLKLELLNGWLFGIDESRVRDEATRQKVLTYKRECYRVLYLHFLGQADEPEDAPRERILMPGDADFAQAVRLVREARLARGAVASLALWRMIGLPWVPELEEAPAPAATLGEDDVVARFALEGIERVEGVMTPTSMLWAAFVQFCKMRRLQQVSEKSFYSRFARLGFSKRKH